MAFGLTESNLRNEGEKLMRRAMFFYDVDDVFNNILLNWIE